MKGVRNIDLGYRPLDVHVPFHESGARYKCAIGGVGSGKSVALCAEAIAFGLEQPGSDMLMTRRFVPHLRDSTEQIFFNLLPHELRTAGSSLRMGGHYDSFTFPNGSQIKFRGLEDWTKYKSMNLAWIGFDEVDEQTEANVVGMSTRLRQTAPLREARERGYRKPAGPMRNQVCMASNPAGKNWVWKAFVNKETQWSDSSVHISTTLDNPYLPLDYITDLLSRPMAFVRRYVLTQFDSAAGQIYETWNWRDNVVPRLDLEGTREFVMWQGMDPGITTASPCAALWVVHDAKANRLVGVKEYQEPNLAARQHATNWRRIEAELPWRTRWRVADPAISRRDPGTGVNVASIYRRLGYSFTPGPLHHNIRIPALDELIRAGRFVVTEDCPMTFDQISNYRWEDQLPQHADIGGHRETVKKGNDHLVDCSQYLASRWLHRAPALAPVVEGSEYEIWQREIMRKVRAQASGGQSSKLVGDGEIF